MNPTRTRVVYSVVIIYNIMYNKVKVDMYVHFISVVTICLTRSPYQVDIKG